MPFTSRGDHRVDTDNSRQRKRPAYYAPGAVPGTYKHVFFFLTNLDKQVLLPFSFSR